MIVLVIQISALIVMLLGPDADPGDQNHADPCRCGCGFATLSISNHCYWLVIPLFVPYW